jgi:nitrate reductase NapA
MDVTRREFLKCAAASSALMAIGGPLAFAATEQPVDKWVKGVCRFCGTGCGVMVGVKNKQAVTVKGDPNNHNGGFLCLKGALMTPIIYAKERLTQPLIRKNGELVEVSWWARVSPLDLPRPSALYSAPGFALSASFQNGDRV